MPAMLSRKPREAGRHGASEEGLTWALDPGDRNTVVRARALVEGTLTVLGATRSAVEDAETMTAELVGNAVRHARPPIELRVSAAGESVRVAVTDGDTRPPAFPPDEPDATSVPVDDGNLDQLVAGLEEFGRGLALVQRLSDGQCGSDAVAPEHGASGKVVWFHQSLSGPRRLH